MTPPAQALLDGNGGGAIGVQRKTARRWLDGALFDGQGRPMKTTYSLKAIAGHGRAAKRRYWYYTSKPQAGSAAGKPERLPAQEIEATVRDAMTRTLTDRNWLADGLSELEATAEETGAVLLRASELASRPEEADDSTAGAMIAPLLRRVDQQSGQLIPTIDLAHLIDARERERPLEVKLEIPITLHQHGRNRPIVVHANSGAPHRDAHLIALVADARRWMAELTSGAAASAEEITRREGLRNGAVSRVLPLAWLSPEIATAILDGRQPPTLSVKRLRDLPVLPLDRSAQRKLLDFPER